MTGCVLLLAAGLAACGSPGNRGGVAAGGRCAAERAAFAAAARALAVAASPVEAAAYAAAKPDSAANPVAAAGSLEDKAKALPAAADGVAASFRSLAACRDSAGPALAGESRTGERAAYDADLAAARESLDLLRTCGATLPPAVERLSAGASPDHVRALRAATAVSPPQPSFIALETAAIHAGPDSSSLRIADLRKGTRALGTGQAAAAGWTPLRLNDGSVGYVDSAALRPVAPNPSALRRLPADPARATEGDPLVALSLVARRDLPAGIATLSALIDAAAAAEARLFPPVAAVGVSRG